MQKAKKIVSWAILFAMLPRLALADTNPNQFGHGCPSQGLLAGKASQYSGAIRGALEQLRKDPACTVFIDASQTLIDEAIKALDSRHGQNEQGSVSRAVALPLEIMALKRAGTMSSSTLQAQVSNAIIQKVIESSELISSNHALTGSAADKKVIAAVGKLQETKNSEEAKIFGILKESLDSMAERSTRSASTAASSITKLVTNMQANRQCIMNGNSKGMAAIVGVVQTVAAFVSNDNAAGSDLAAMLTSFQEMIRNKPFAETVRSLNQVDFVESTACLLESTIANYCDSVDDAKLFNKEKDDENRRLKFSLERAKADAVRGKIRKDPYHPLAGLTVLMRDVPKVTHWIGRIRTGLVPTWEQDADRLNSIYGVYVNTQTARIRALGVFNQKRIVLKNQTDYQGRRGEIISLVGQLIGALGGVGGIPGQQSESYYMKGFTTDQMYFKLLGGYHENEIGLPDQVAGVNKKGEGVTTIPADVWLRTMPEAERLYFKKTDTERIVDEVIYPNLLELFDRTSRIVTNLFVQQLAPDVVNLVGEASVGPGISVRQSLRNISHYLENLQEIRKQEVYYEGKEVIDFEINTTRARVDNTLKAFEKLSGHLGSLNGLSDQEKEKRIKETEEKAKEDRAHELNKLETETAQKLKEIEDEEGKSAALIKQIAEELRKAELLEKKVGPPAEKSPAAPSHPKGVPVPEEEEPAGELPSALLRKRLEITKAEDAEAKTKKSLKLLALKKRKEDRLKEITSEYNAAVGSDGDKSDKTEELKFRDFIHAVFANFNVMLQMETFLQNRMAILIRDDLTRRARAIAATDKYTSDLMLLAGDEIAAKMGPMGGVQQTEYRSDLDGALRRGTQNIAALEKFFGPLLFWILDEVQTIARNEPHTIDAINQKTRTRASNDSFVYTRNNQVDGAIRRVNPVRWVSRLLELEEWYDPNRYPIIPRDALHVELRDTANGMFDRLLSEVCLSTLAFSNPGAYFNQCNGTLVKSDNEMNRRIRLGYEDADGARREQILKGTLHAGYDQYVDPSPHFLGELKPEFQTPARRDEATCALHRFRVRNSVYTILKDSEPVGSTPNREIAVPTGEKAAAVDPKKFRTFGQIAVQDLTAIKGDDKKNAEEKRKEIAKATENNLLDSNDVDVMIQRNKGKLPPELVQQARANVVQDAYLTCLHRTAAEDEIARWLEAGKSSPAAAIKKSICSSGEAVKMRFEVSL